MTDEQIIKALECCATDDGDDCSQCPYGNIVYKPGNGGCVNRCRKDALDLINRQRAEIKSLRWHAEGLENRTLALNDTNKMLTDSQETYIKNKIKELAEGE